MSTRADRQKIRYTVLWHLVRDDPHTRRTLEIFLRALYASYLRHRDEPCTVDLMCALLEDGFTGEPVAFDPGWMRFLDKPEWHAHIGTPVRVPSREGFERVILRQIADLHAMTPEQLENIDRYLGGTAPSGQTWQHANLADFLYMASSSPEDYEEPERELARLEALYLFDGVGGTQPVGAGHDELSNSSDASSEAADDPAEQFGWEDIEGFLVVGQELE